MNRSLAVLFDLDGTLIDSIDFILASVRHTFADRPRGPSDADWIAGIGTPLRAQLAEYADDDGDLERLVECYRQHQRAHHDEMTRCYAGVREAVAGIRADGHRVGVVTSKLVEPASRALRHVGLDEMIEVLVGADGCERHKPHPEPVLRALALLGAAPEAAVFIGDSPHDIAAGNAAGVATAAVLWGACSREVLLAARPRHVLAAVDELHPLVRALARTPVPDM
ncbi:MAG TPA: HAD-IA family hydrolase [Anaeromyxobacteraceae bacterium]|nr:HAD-IA family hydrolase [Anaeromyxobacteraceae bacterium]